MKARMMESLQLPILAIALIVMSWAIMRLNSSAASAAIPLDVPPEVLQWRADIKRLSQELQSELDEKMAAVSALSQAYEQASHRLSSLIHRAERLEAELGRDEQIRLSA
jgi:hypothetical protein